MMPGKQQILMTLIIYKKKNYSILIGWEEPKRLVQFQLFEKLTRAN